MTKVKVKEQSQANTRNSQIESNYTPMQLPQIVSICYLLLALFVDAFTVHRGAPQKVWKLPRDQPHVAVVSNADRPSPTTRKEKLTKEAEELLIALAARDGSSIDKPNLIVAQVAPSVRIAFSEEFGRDPGEFSPGILVAALKELGFDLVFDTNTAADLSVVEEGTELLHRLRAKRKEPVSGFGTASRESEPLPLFTSCCPGWMNCVEKSAPELVPYISTCKSPHMMYGAVVKEFSTKLLGQPPEKVYFTSVMPCVRKRGESDRPAFMRNGVRDVDNVITTKDLGTLLRMKGIDPSQLQPIDFDSPFQTDGTGSGAGQLFGATGGVMEAAVRTVYELATGNTLPRLEFDEVRGLEGVKEAVIPLHTEGMTGLDEPLTLRVAVCSGLGNAKQLIKKLKNGEVNYDFVEVMACPGGCIAGGGQPIGKPETIQKRLDTIYALDRSLPVRKSHENPTVQAVYDHLLGEPGSETAHRILHVAPVYGGVSEDQVNQEEMNDCM